MKKFLKIFAIAAIAVAAAIACVFVGCNKNDDNTDNGNTTADYTFILVYEGGDKDGQPVTTNYEGGTVFTQICLPGVGATCNPVGKGPDANGKISLSQAEVNSLLHSDTDVTVFVFHALYVLNENSDHAIEVNGKGEYTLKVTVA